MWAILKTFLLVSGGLALGFLFVNPWLSFGIFFGQYILARVALLQDTFYSRVAVLGLIVSALALALHMVLS
jgi:hypothetical protein